MSKLVFVLAALCAFALANEVRINDYPCMWHVSYNYYDPNIDMNDDGEENTVIHEYGMINDEVFYVYEKGTLLSDPTVTTYDGVIRGDKYLETEDGVDYYYCYYKYYVDSKNPCEEDSCPSERRAPFVYTSMEKDIECIDGSMGCSNYTDEDGTTVMINRAGRYVIDPDGYVYTWYNDVGTVSMFETYFCENTTVIPAPDPICQTQNGRFEPADYPCFYHYTYIWQDEDNDRPVLVHEKGMFKDDLIIFLELGYNVNDETDEYYHAVARGDMPIREGVYYRVDYDRDDEGEYVCTDDEGESNIYVNPPFDYVFAEEKACPESSAKCMYYTNITGDTVVANANNLYIVDPDGYNIEWHDDGLPTVEDFAKYKKCDGSDLRVPLDVCVESSSQTSQTSQTSSSHGTPSSSSSHGTASSSSHGTASSSSHGTASSSRGSGKSSAAPEPSSAALHSLSVAVMVLVAVALLL